MIDKKTLLNSIENCTLCKSGSLLSGLITYNKPLSFYGSEKPKVMIIGHSPSVRTKEPATVVLKLNKPSQPLYRYINEFIVKPLGISFSDIYATNLIKCYTTKLPEDIKRVDFFKHSFKNCKQLLEEEIESIKPKLVISLSERVLKVLSNEYMGKTLTMKESFAKLFQISINGNSYNYIPLVHIPKGENSLVKLHYFPEQTERLRSLNIKL